MLMLILRTVCIDYRVVRGVAVELGGRRRRGRRRHEGGLRVGLEGLRGFRRHITSRVRGGLAGGGRLGVVGPVEGGRELPAGDLLEQRVGGGLVGVVQRVLRGVVQQVQLGVGVQVGDGGERGVVEVEVAAQRGQQLVEVAVVGQVGDGQPQRVPVGLVPVGLRRRPGRRALPRVVLLLISLEFLKKKPKSTSIDISRMITSNPGTKFSCRARES